MADIKTRFTIEGEQQYRKAMNDATNAVKVLNSQQKLAKAQFQNTGDAEKYAAQQADILRKKIEQQKTSVKAAEAALKQLSDQGVSANNRQMQQWQVKLNNAQTALEQMEAELKEVNGTMQQTGSTAQETSDAVESIGKKVSYDAVINGLGKITGAMGSAARKAKELAGELVSTMKDAAAWSDDLATTATVYGISTEELQRMQYTADIIDTSVESIMKARQKQINNMIYGNEEVQKTFEELGVATREFVNGKYGDVAGEFRDWEDVFWDLGEALMNIEDVELRDAMAMKIWGKGFSELKPMFDNDWAEKGFGSAREYYEATMKSWEVVSDENVARLNALDDTVQKVENNFDTLKGTILGELAPAFTEVGNTVSDLLAEFNEYLNSPEGQEKLSELSDAVAGLFEGLTNVDFGAALDTAKGALESLTDGLGWIKENWSAVETGLKAIGVAFGLMKVSEGVLTFMQLLSSGKFLFGGGGKSTGAGGGNPVTIPTTPVTTPSSGASPVESLAPSMTLYGIRTAFEGWAKQAMATVTQGLSGIGPFGLGAVGDWFMNQTELGLFFKGERTWDEVLKSVTDFGEGVIENVATFKEDWAGLLDELGWKKDGPEKELSPYMFLSQEMMNNLQSWWENRGKEEEPQLSAVDFVKRGTDFQEYLSEVMRLTMEAARGRLENMLPEWFTEDVNLDDTPFLNVTPAQWEAMEEAWDAIRNFGWMSDEGLGALNSLRERFDYDEEGMQALTEAYEAMRGLAQFGWTGENLPEWWVDREFWPKDEEVDMPVVPTLPEDAAAQMQAVLDGMALTVPVAPRVSGGEEGEGYANGLPYVPFDGYPAILHKGERVVPAREISSRSYSSNLYVENMNMNGGADAEGLAAAMAAAQRRTMAGFGS